MDGERADQVWKRLKRPIKVLAELKYALGVLSRRLIQ